MDIDEKIDVEINTAERSREAGNEGMARVCARRAAGLAVRWFINQIGQDRPELNNFELLSDPPLRDYLPTITYLWLDHLSMRVDANHDLPGGIDLVADAKNVIRLLRQGGVKSNG